MIYSYKINTGLFLLLCSSLLFANDVPTEVEPNHHLEFIESSSLDSIIRLSPAIIEQELKKVNRKKSGLSKKALVVFQKELLARYHPEALKKSTLRLFKSQQEVNSETLDKMNIFFKDDANSALTENINAALLKENQQALVGYQLKIIDQPPQNHRKKMARAYDGLNHVSQWQHSLRRSIQEEILAQISESGKADAYQVASPEQQLERLRAFNEIIYLYAFRQTPALEIVPVLNFLAEENHQQAFNLLAQSFERSLKHRSELNLKLN